MRTDKSIRIGIYARVSSTDQDCQQQLTRLREYSGARRWVIHGEYVDNGISGTKSFRPAMNQLMEAARRRAIDAVVCWKIDRWGRSMPHFVSSEQDLSNLGVRFIAVTQSIDTDEGNPTARLLLNLLAAFAEFESEMICERTRAGLERARRAGRIGGRPRLVLNRERILALNHSGMTTRQIARGLDTSPSSIYHILKTCRPAGFQSLSTTLVAENSVSSSGA